MKLRTTIVSLLFAVSFGASANPFKPPLKMDIGELEQCSPSQRDPVLAGLMDEAKSKHLTPEQQKAQEAILKKAQTYDELQDTTKFKFIAGVNDVEIYFDLNKKKYVEIKIDE